MNLIIKVSFNNYDEWKASFDDHAERASVCDESRTTVGKIDDQNCIVMLYDVDMVGIQSLMSSDFLVELSEKMNIKIMRCNPLIPYLAKKFVTMPLCKLIKRFFGIFFYIIHYDISVNPRVFNKPFIGFKSPTHYPG